MNLIKLNKLKKVKLFRKARLGRGHSSKGGKCGRGSDGQNAREKSCTEGGQFPSYLRFKKVGFVSHKKKKVFMLTLMKLFELINIYKDNKYFSIEKIRQHFNIHHSLKIKIINYDLNDNFNIEILNNFVFEFNFCSKSIHNFKFIKII